MPELPEEIISVLKCFSSLFSRRIWPRACLLLIGAILYQGPRTVSSALRILGLSEEKRFERYHTLERRKGKNIKAKGRYQEPVRSGDSYLFSRFYVWKT